MTLIEYFFAKIVTSFSYTAIVKHRELASSEALLERQLKEVLGKEEWKNLGNIEQLTKEQINLPDHIRQYKELQTEITRLEKKRTSSQELRTKALESLSLQSRELITEEKKITESIARLRNEMKKLQADGRSLKIKHTTFKNRLESLLRIQPHENKQEIEKITGNLTFIEESFRPMLTRNEELEQQVRELEKSLIFVSPKIREVNFLTRQQAKEASTQEINAAKELLNLKENLAIRKNKIRLFFKKIGEYIIENEKNPDLQDIVKRHRKLIKKAKRHYISHLRHRRLV